MTPTTLIELALAAALLGGGGWLYFKRGREDGGYGSQTAVLLIVIGLIVAIHGLGGLEYRPSEAEMARR